MPFGDYRIGFHRQPSEHRNRRRLANRRIERSKVGITSHAVDYYARKPQPQIERLKPSYHGGNTARAVSGIQNQNNRQIQQLGNFGCAAFLRTASHAVEEPHHSFDYGCVTIGGGTGKSLPVGFSVEHPGIEIARGTICNQREMSAIDEVRAALEGLHRQMPRAQCRDDCESHRGLAYATGRACNYKSFHGRTSTVPLSASGSPATMSNTLSAMLATRWLISPSTSRYCRPSG